jgi:hypothetical protein
MGQFLNNNIISYDLMYSILLQIYHISYILHKNNYLHSDTYTNTGNITINPSKLKTITITINEKQYKIPTNGCIVSFIDYERMENKLRENLHWDALNTDFGGVAFRYLVSLFHIIVVFKKIHTDETISLYIYKNHREFWNKTKILINQWYQGHYHGLINMKKIQI